MSRKYYMFTFEDAYDDSFGNSHPFINEIALSSDSFLFPSYDKKHISKTEITEAEYEGWCEVN